MTVIKVKLYNFIVLNLKRDYKGYLNQFILRCIQTIFYSIYVNLIFIKPIGYCYTFYCDIYLFWSTTF